VTGGVLDFAEKTGADELVAFQERRVGEAGDHDGQVRREKKVEVRITGPLAAVNHNIIRVQSVQMEEDLLLGGQGEPGVAAHRG